MLPNPGTPSYSQIGKPKESSVIGEILASPPVLK